MSQHEDIVLGSYRPSNNTQKQDHLLGLILDLQAMMTSVLGCQEQRTLIAGESQGGWRGRA